jgi:hypothetical protein
MAKGQIRGNREIRKPKKEKGPVIASAADGMFVKAAGSTIAFGKKK